jgi:hypothetical protein
MIAGPQPDRTRRYGAGVLALRGRRTNPLCSSDTRRGTMLVVQALIRHAGPEGQEAGACMGLAS